MRSKNSDEAINQLAARIDPHGQSTELIRKAVEAIVEEKYWMVQRGRRATLLAVFSLLSAVLVFVAAVLGWLTKAEIDAQKKVQETLTTMISDGSIERVRAAAQDAEKGSSLDRLHNAEYATRRLSQELADVALLVEQTMKRLQDNANTYAKLKPGTEADPGMSDQERTGWGERLRSAPWVRRHAADLKTELDQLLPSKSTQPSPTGSSPSTLPAAKASPPR